MSLEPPRVTTPLVPAVLRFLTEQARDTLLSLRGTRAPATLARPMLRQALRLGLAERLPREPLNAAAVRLSALQAKGSRIVTDFGALETVLAARAPLYKVVGFDVFNTVLCRRVEGEWLKTAVAYHLHELLRPWLASEVRPTVALLRERRRALEVQVATDRVARGEDNEVSHDELLRRWVGEWLPRHAPDAIAAVRAYELQLERLALRPTPGIERVLERVRAAGCRVIFVSDMYFCQADVQDLLDANGLGRFFDAGYVSNEEGVRKATGRLFPVVLQREGLTPGQLLFVGDDLEADQKWPNRLGIDSVHVVDGPELHRRERLKNIDALVAETPAYAARLVQEVMGQEPRSVRPDGDIDYRTGLTLAPGLVAYVLEAVERAQTFDIRRLFFLAREGLTFLRIFALLKKHGAFGTRPVPEARYLFLSRASTILPSMRSFTWDDIWRFWRQYRRQSLRQLLKNLSLPEAVFVPMGIRCGLDDPDCPIEDPENDEAFQSFLHDREVQAQFRVHRDAARTLLRRYLEYRGLMGEQRVGFLDIGWKGSMQDNLARAFADDEEYPEVHGMYVGLVDASGVTGRSLKYGFLVDVRRGDVQELDVFRNTAIYEMVTTANHGSTLGYEQSRWSQRVVLPRLKQYELERENARHFFVPAQQAIFDWTEDFARVRPLVPFSADELKPGVLDQVLRYIRFPTREEADAFLRYSHVESFGVHTVTRFGFDLKLAEFFTMSPGKLKAELERRFEHTLWREAVVRRTGLPLANLFYDAWISWKQVR